MPSTVQSNIAARISSRLPIYDFIGAQPVDHGFCPLDEAHAILQCACDAIGGYQPDSAGQLAAREAVANWHGGSATPSSVLLTPGTSVAYLLAFRLLARPRGYVLVPRPTYPLFEDLARLAGIEVRHYGMTRTVAGWVPDIADLEFQISPDCAAVIVVSPHNPTGSVMRADSLERLSGAANRFGATVILDEVFRTMTLDATLPVPRPAECGADLALTFNGLSKMLSLPGIKAGWMVVEGAGERVASFIEASAYALDTLLPVSEITQAALPELMTLAALRTESIRARWFSAMTDAHAQWSRVAESWNATTSLSFPDAAPYLIVPLPPGTDAIAAEASLARGLGVITHAGDFYGLEDPALVVTCVQSPASAMGGDWFERLRDAATYFTARS